MKTFIFLFSLFFLSNSFAFSQVDDLLATDKDESKAVDEWKKSQTEAPKSRNKVVEDPHFQVYHKTRFPSAKQCASCHQEIYDEWKISSHAYASVSPMFHKFEQAISNLTQGSIKNFCVRCHASVGTTLNEPREMAIWDRSPVSREGITCITCHRISEEFGKVNGERNITPGNVHDPVTAAGDGAALQEAIDKKMYYKVSSSPKETGMPIHNKVIKFNSLSKSEFCMGCHQVAVHPGIKLEVVWDQYMASPAKKQGIECIDCHMGKNPGVADGFATGPAAVINGKALNPHRKRHNHVFYGPGYPIAHPGIFPFNDKANKYKIQDWLKFDYRSDWGKKDFETKVMLGKIKANFPEVWEDQEDRMEARLIVDENIKGMQRKADYRKQLMNNSSKIDGPFFDDDLKVGEDLDFHYIITNTNSGHNLPSGSLGAQPQVWVNVALVDPDGKNIWESGHLDSNGDMADIHSIDVQRGKMPHDDQLVNFQAKFLTTNVKGTDREMYLPVNFDLDQRPFIRPAGAPNTVLNHPAFIRMEQHSIPPLGKRKVNYSVPSKLMKKPGKYKLAIRLRSRAEPIYFMLFVGATKDMIRSMNEWIGDSHEYAVEFEVKK